MPLYKGKKTSQISFPLGGIGTGCIGLGGNGRLIDWEIFNRPDKGSLNGYSHLAVKASDGDRTVDARVLAGDMYCDFAGQHGNRLQQHHVPESGRRGGQSVVYGLR